MDSLVTEEVKKRIDNLLGKVSSRMFVTFCRVLFSKPEGTDTSQNTKNLGGWIDYNIMGYFAGIIVRSQLKGHQIYIGLLFDYNALFFKQILIFRLLMLNLRSSSLIIWKNQLSSETAATLCHTGMCLFALFFLMRTMLKLSIME